MGIAADFSKFLGPLRHRSHKRCSSEGNPITLAEMSAGRDSTSSSGSWDGSSGPVKRVIVVVDHSNEARLALLWALSHVVHRLDVVTLLYVSKSGTSQQEAAQDSQSDRQRLRRNAKCCELTSSLKSLCLERRPEIEVEVLVLEGDKGPTIVGQSRKLDASLIVLGQRKLGFLWRLLRVRSDGLIDYCIQNADCLTLAVRRKSKKVGGYLINSKWQKNFWLLA